MGCAENQDDSCILSSADKIKQKIIHQIKSNELSKTNRGGDTKLPVNKSQSQSHGRTKGHYYCPCWKCCIPTSPLLDALAIDFLQGNHYQTPFNKKSSRPVTTSAHHILAAGPYCNCLRMSCEDVACLESRVSQLSFDCPESRVSQLGFDCPKSRVSQLGFDCPESRVSQPGFDCPSTAACPSLQLRLGHGDTGDLGGCDGVANPHAADYNFNCRPSLPWSGYTTSRHQREEGQGMVSAAGGLGGVSSSAGCVEAGDAEGTAAHSDSSISGTSAQHRRRDFHKTSHSGWTTTITTSASTTSDSSLPSSLNDGSLDLPFGPTPPPPFSHPAAPASVSEVSSKTSMALPGQCSPAGFRRMSFLAAVDKSKGKDVDWSRRPSYRAAIDPRYLVGEMPSTVAYCGSERYDGGMPAAAQSSENKTVTFQLGDEDISRSLRTGGDTAATHASRVAAVVISAASQSSLLSLSSSLSSSSDSDSSARTADSLAPSRGGGGQQRKLSMVEEEDSEESSRTAERRSSPTCLAGPRPPTAAAPLPSATGSFGNNLISSQQKELTVLTRSTEQPSHASADGSLSEDMKAYLIDPEQDKMAGQVTPCNADNVPAYYKPKSELQAEARAAATAAKTSATSRSSSGHYSDHLYELSADVSATSRTSSSGHYTDHLYELSADVSGSFALVPGSPPTTPRDDGLAPAATQSRLAKLRQNNLARKREQMKTMKMPELSEHAETSDCELATVKGNGPARSSSVTGNNDNDASGPSAEVADSGGGGGSHARDWVGPPSPSGDPVTPSLPEAFLKRLGLSTEGRALVNGDLGIEDVPDKLLLEKRFNSLSLAFKTDRLTLEKRLEIQERSRDLTEQNIDRELQGLRDATELLKQMCQDEQVQEVADKIQHHLEILEPSIARLSSRAEVLGAVQQEKRMCLAMDVMITFTENIRRLREKEQSEVEEARKVLTERQLTTSLSMDSFGIGDRRSASVCAPLNNAGRTNRRRSDVAIPKIFGGSGAHLHLNSSMEPRQRFQAATANVTVKNAVTSTLRRSSMERQKNLSLQSSTASSSSAGLGPSTNSSIDKSQDKDAGSKQHSQEEEAYRHGYEEGLKASLGRELTELRDQQTHISGNLEQVMDRVETLQHEDQARDTELEDAMSKLKESMVKVRQWWSNPNWQSASHTLRRLAAGLIFLVALVVVVITFIPLVPGHVELRNHGRPAQ